MNSLQNILLVDDSPRDTEMAVHALESCNLANEVTTLRDGSEALDYLYCRGDYAKRPHGHPAVILLDLKMPRVDGIEVLRQIKGDPDLRFIPVVMMTSSREEQDIARCYLLGSNAYVVKPVNFHEFVEAVRRVGAFWGVINAPPPAVLQRSLVSH
jgi:two-component system, response regulator